MELSLSFPARVFAQLLQPLQGGQQELQQGKAPTTQHPYMSPAFTHLQRHMHTDTHPHACSIYVASSP